MFPVVSYWKSFIYALFIVISNSAVGNDTVGEVEQESEERIKAVAIWWLPEGYVANVIILTPSESIPLFEVPASKIKGTPVLQLHLRNAALIQFIIPASVILLANLKWYLPSEFAEYKNSLFLYLLVPEPFDWFQTTYLTWIFDGSDGEEIGI